MLGHELSRPKGRLLLGVLMLEDAGRNHNPVPGVDTVVSYESRHFADDGHVVLLDQLRHLLRVAHAIVPSNRKVHSFGLPPSHIEGGVNRPCLKSYNAATLASIGTRRIPQMSDIRNVLGELLPRTPSTRSSENYPSRDCLETPTHGPTSSPSASSSPRRQRPPRWRTAFRSPSSFDGYERSTRRCAPPPTSSATP